ncbi:hypothetical protein [Streptomyces sp. NPDC056663]
MAGPVFIFWVRPVGHAWDSARSWPFTAARDTFERDGLEGHFLPGA